MPDDGVSIPILNRLPTVGIAALTAYLGALYIYGLSDVIIKTFSQSVSQLVLFHMHVLLFILPFVPLLYPLLITLLHARFVACF